MRHRTLLLRLIVQTVVQKVVKNYCFSRVSERTLGTFWARFWRCSVLQGYCVFLSSRVRFEPREEEQQQQQEQQDENPPCFDQIHLLNTDNNSNSNNNIYIYSDDDDVDMVKLYGTR